MPPPPPTGGSGNRPGAPAPPPPPPGGRRSAASASAASPLASCRRRPASACRSSSTAGRGPAAPAARGWGGWGGNGAEGLGELEGNWRGEAVLREGSIVARYDGLQMKVRDRHEGPRVMIREHYCPACAASLVVDVVTEDLDPLPTPQTAGSAKAVV